MSSSTLVAGVPPATPAETRPADHALDVTECASLLADVGFLLVPGAPMESGAAYLLVALRQRPTLAHFDPERIEFWMRSGGHSEPAEVSWAERPQSSSFRWGTIRLIDRVPEVNRFVAFGGRLAIANRPDMRIVSFVSEAPILSLNEHAGPADPLAASVSGFFATLRAAAGVAPSLGRAAESATPNALYAAYLQFGLQHYATGLAAEVAPIEIVSWLRTERDRLEATHTAEADAGRRLAREIDEFRRRHRP